MTREVVPTSTSSETDKGSSWLPVAMLAAVTGGVLYVCHEIGKASRPVSDTVAKGRRFFQSKEAARETTAKNALANIGAGVEIVATATVEAGKAATEVVTDAVCGIK